MIRSLALTAAGIADFNGGNSQNDGMRDMDPRLVIQGGRSPIKIADALAGGIGVSGAPSGDLDAVCDRARLDAIGTE